MLIYLDGHVDFRNRGSEALIRTSTMLLRERWPDARFICPSSNPAYDARQWPEAASFGVEFIQLPSFPSSLVWWGRLERRLPLVSRWGFPSFRIADHLKAAIGRSDLVLVTGGDVFSDSYGNNSLAYWVGLTEFAIDMGKPVHLWAGSVGSHSAFPYVEQNMLRHLRRYRSISVRESVSQDSLKSFGINSRLVVDPAFVLSPEVWPGLDPQLFTKPVLGLNVCSHARRLGSRKGRAELYDDEVRKFIQHVLATTDLTVLLIPHVDPLVGTDDDSDSEYLARLVEGMQRSDGRLSQVPSNLNVSQLKYVIGKCSYFIGGRTHSTIAALSQFVPTISLSWSVKSIGINRDLFGHTDYVLPSRELSCATLVQKLKTIQDQKQRIVEKLRERIPVWQRCAHGLPDSLPVA